MEMAIIPANARLIGALQKVYAAFDATLTRSEAAKKKAPVPIGV